jgi:hypothetical protein
VFVQLESSQLASLAYLSYLATQVFAFRVPMKDTRASSPPWRKAARGRDGPKRGCGCYPPGLHFKLPWQQARVDSRSWRRSSISRAPRGREHGHGRRTERRSASTPCSAIMPVSRRALQLRLRHDVAPKEHITGLFTCLLRNEIANFRCDGRQQPCLEGGSPGGSYALLPAAARASSTTEIMTYCKDRDRVAVRDPLQRRRPGRHPPTGGARRGPQRRGARADARRDDLRARGGPRRAPRHRRHVAGSRLPQMEAMRRRGRDRDILAAQLDEARSRANTLELYVARRSAEVLSQSRHHYVRRPR